MMIAQLFSFQLFKQACLRLFKVSAQYQRQNTQVFGKVGDGLGERLTAVLRNY
jgi:hypothetical protein|tara:strand:- start:369 stop:527 length:159 start_codon:yes stop_codon:yes gene_type:complete